MLTISFTFLRSPFEENQKLLEALPKVGLGEISNIFSPAVKFKAFSHRVSIVRIDKCHNQALRISIYNYQNFDSKY